MNSYPVELLVQHVPVMFVAGLGLPQHARNSSESAPVGVNGHAVPDGRETSPQELRDPFTILAARLRNALGARRRSVIWDPDKSHRFNVLLVDKEVRFPPRKILPPQHATGLDEPYSSAPGVLHSPLSPLTPSSPLYPDGLIAPIWVRKHLELIPSVFVLFLRIWEPPQPTSPLEINNQDRDEERARDTDLTTEIGLRKKSASERGIKLTVVLMASRHMLEEPTLDARLSFIRRQSGLDARAALFVLSPLSTSELNEFVTSLQEALYESATDYYGAHSKRVRRKKNRYSHQATPLPPGSGPSTGRPLRSEGWTVRYEYKMATFAEFRMEDELARKHYEDCWEALRDMFGSTAILPPRTKRWAEAKVLADSVSFKICKLYLYHSEFTHALAHFNRHLHRFAELQRGWGIGEETFEFWSWVARQYRVLAEMLEYGARAGLQLPSPITLSAGTQSATPISTPSVVSAGVVPATLGINPSNTIQHPGYYYYAAASCTQQRYQRFLAISSQEDPSTTSSPALANERKVDHQAIIIELYTKAYELFKSHGAGNGRLTFHMAYRIAEAYYSAGKFDLAVKFFERIAKTYQREKWGVMLRPILAMWCECGRQMGDVELTVRLLLEMLAREATDSSEERHAIEEELVAIFRSTSPTRPVVLESSDFAPILHPSVIFWKSEVSLGEPASFQVTLTAGDGGLPNLEFSLLHIYWDENHPPIIIEHFPSEDPSAHLHTDLGQLRSSGISEGPSQPSPIIKSDLRWNSNDPKVFYGRITSSVPVDLKIPRLALFLNTGSWDIEIPINTTNTLMSATDIPRWLTTIDPPARFIPVHRPNSQTCRVQFQPHRLHISFQHDEPALIDEQYPIIIEVTNEDDKDLQFDIDVLLQPSEDEGVNHITLGDESSTSLIKGVSFGVVEPGGVVKRTLYLHSTGTGGDRILDLSIQSHTIQPKSSDMAPNANETLCTLVVHAIPAMKSSFTITYTRDPEPLPPLLDLSKYEPDAVEGQSMATTTVAIISSGPWEIVVDSLRYKPENVRRARVASCSLSFVEDEFPCSWSHGDTFSLTCEVDLYEENNEDFSEDEIPFPGHFEVTWRRSGITDPNIASAKTILNVPSLRPPDDGLVALLDCPPSGQLHHPFGLRLTVQNRQKFRTAEPILDVDSSEAFVLSGPRHARLPMLLPGTSDDVFFNLIPLSCGFVRLPTFKVHDRRKLGVLREDEEGSSTNLSGDVATNSEEDRIAAARVPVLVVGRDIRQGRDSLDLSVPGDELSLDGHFLPVYPS